MPYTREQFIPVEYREEDKEAKKEAPEDNRKMLNLDNPPKTETVQQNNPEIETETQKNKYSNQNKSTENHQFAGVGAKERRIKILFSNSPNIPGLPYSKARGSATWVYLGSMLLEQTKLGLNPIVDLKDIQVKDFNLTQNPQDYGEMISKFAPDMVGTTIYETNWRQAREFFRIVKEAHPKAICAIGGPAPTNIPKAMLRLTGADLAFRGEADFTFRKAIELLKSGARIQDLSSEVEGVVARENQNFIIGDTSINIPIISHSNYSKIQVNFELFRKIQESNQYETTDFVFSRDCPYPRCSFCQISPVDRYRQLPIGQAIETIKQISSMPYLRYLVFGDGTFGGSNKRANQFVDKMLAEKLTKLEYFCEISADIFLIGKFGEMRKVDKELLKKMKQAGFFSFELGIEHLSHEGLKAYNKYRYTPDEAEKVIQAAIEAELYPSVSLIHYGGVDMRPQAIVEHLENWFRLVVKFKDKVRWGISEFANIYTNTAEYQKVLSAFKQNPITALNLKRAADMLGTWQEIEDKGYPYIFEHNVHPDPSMNQLMILHMIKTARTVPYILPSIPQDQRDLFLAFLFLESLREQGASELVNKIKIPIELRALQQIAQVANRIV